MCGAEKATIWDDGCQKITSVPGSIEHSCFCNTSVNTSGVKLNEWSQFFFLVLVVRACAAHFFGILWQWKIPSEDETILILVRSEAPQSQPDEKKETNSHDVSVKKVLFSNCISSSSWPWKLFFVYKSYVNFISHAVCATARKRNENAHLNVRKSIFVSVIEDDPKIFFFLRLSKGLVSRRMIAQDLWNHINFCS